MKIESSQQRTIYRALLFNFALFGVILTLVGATIPKIIQTFGWSYVATAAVLSAGSVGYFLSTFACGFLVHRLGAKAVLLGGLTLQGLCLFFFARYPSPYLNLAINFLLGAGQGGSEVVTNFSVIRLERPGENRLMSLMHAMFCIGAILGPVLLASLMRASYAWNLLFRVTAGISLFMAAFFARLPFKSVDADTPSASGHTRSVLHDSTLWILAAIILLYVGTELGISNWIAQYYVAELGVQPANAAYMVSVLWSGILLGRLVLWARPWERRQELLLVGFGILCTFFILLALLWQQTLVMASLIFLAGIGYSGIYPIVMALAGDYFKRSQSVASGVISTGGGVGAFLSPFPIAFLAQRWSLRTSFLFCGVLNGVLLLLTLVIWRRSLVRDGLSG